MKFKAYVEPFKKVSHIIFDLDGTLLDTEKLYREALFHVADQYDKECSNEVVLKIAGTPQPITAKIAREELDLPIDNDTFLWKYNSFIHERLGDCDLMPDSEGVYGEALQKTVEEYGKTYPSNLSSKVAGSVQHDVAETVIKLLDLDTTIEEFLKIYVGYAYQKLGDLDLMPGAEKMIQHLYTNNIPIAIATSSQKEATELKTKKFSDLFSHFHHIVCGGSDPEVKVGKPAPDIFLICASRFDESPDPSKCLVFEDSANGVKAALAAKMQVVMIPEDHVPYDIWKMATLRLDSFEYMIPQLFGLPPFPPDTPPVFPEVLEEVPTESTNENSN